MGREVVLQRDNLNAAVSAKHLEQLLDAYPDVPILLLWDRAPGTAGSRSVRCWRPTHAWRCGSF